MRSSECDDEMTSKGGRSRKMEDGKSARGAQEWRSVLWRIGAPDTIRTCDLCLRRATLYPAELRVRAVDLADWPGMGNGLAGRSFEQNGSVGAALPLPGDGHKFESSRARPKSMCRACRDCGGAISGRRAIGAAVHSTAGPGCRIEPSCVCGQAHGVRWRTPSCAT
jgi:hypothetical protein